MRLLTYLLIFSCLSLVAAGQGPGTFSAPFSIPRPYGTPNNATQEISLFTPYDSTSGGYLHPCIIMAGGAGEVNTHNITPNTVAYFAQNNNATLRVRDTLRHQWVTYYIIWLHKNSSNDLDGNWNMKYFKNAWKYATTTLAGKVDPNRIYFSALSLSGGGAADLVRDSLVWCQRFAAGAISDAVVGAIYVDNQSDIFNNINSAGLHVRFWWSDGDVQSNSPTFRDKMKFFYPGTSGNTTRPNLMIVTTGGHGTGWALANDTGHATFSNNATYTPSGTDNPNTLEWFTNFVLPASPFNQLPIANAGSDITIYQPSTSTTLNGSSSYDPDGRPLTSYLWTKISGPAGGSISSPTSATTAVTGLGLGTYQYKLQVTDDSSAVAFDTINVFVLPPVYQAKVFTYFGALYADYDRNKPDFYFDSQKGGVGTADPLNGITGDTTSLTNPSHGWNTTPGGPAKDYDHYGFGTSNKGVRYYMRDTLSRCKVIVDLVGTKNPMDLSRKFVFTNIFGLSNEAAGHRLYFYNYDTLVLNKPLSVRHLFHSRYDSLAKPFAILETNGTLVWVNAAASDSMRFVMIVQSNDAFHHIAQFNELNFYGHYNFDTSSTVYKDSIRQPYKGKLPSRKNARNTFGKSIGTNWFNGMGPLSRRFDGPLRAYWQVSYADTIHDASVPSVLYYPSDRFLDFTQSIMSTIRSEGHDMLLTFQGARNYNGLNGLPTVNADTINAEYESPYQWKADSVQFSEFTKVLGRNASGSNMFTSHPANGQNQTDQVETGNESLFHGYSDLALFFKMYKDRQAVKAIDPTMKVVQAGMVEMGVHTVITDWHYSKMFTADGLMPYDVVNGHKYFGKDSLGAFITLDDQVGAFSEQPEKVINRNTGLIKFGDSVARAMYMYLDTTFEIWHTETGRGGDGTPSANNSQANGWDYFCTPGFGIYDSLQAKAVLNFRQAILSMYTPFNRVCFYSIVNQVDLGTTQGNQLFWSYGRYNSRNGVTMEGAGANAEAYVWASAYPSLKDYYPDTVLINGSYTGRWQVKFRKLGTDSVCHVTWFGTRNGTSGTQTISLPGMTSVTEVKPSFVSETPTVTALSTFSDKTVSRTVTELPIMFFGVEANTTPQYNYLNLYRH